MILNQLYLAMPSRATPAAPTNTPAFMMPQGRAKLPEPMLALAKLKNVATSLQTWKSNS